jgi:hypothetical protein
MANLKVNLRNVVKKQIDILLYEIRINIRDHQQTNFITRKKLPIAIHQGEPQL